MRGDFGGGGGCRGLRAQIGIGFGFEEVSDTVRVLAAACRLEGKQKQIGGVGVGGPVEVGEGVGLRSRVRCSERAL